MYRKTSRGSAKVLMISYSNLSFVSVQAVDHEKEVEGPEVPLCPGLLTHEIAAREVVSEKKNPLKCIQESISLNTYFYMARNFSSGLKGLCHGSPVQFV